ncbi:MAG: hypothetical protein LLG20_10720 [Acidobacteriales bacterium]|nr:hypothetical protein [Terriglobales bacterium]
MMKPAGPAEAQAAIERFLDRSRQPALLEPGEEPIPLEPGQYALEHRGEKLWIHAWDKTRNLTRRIAGVASETAGKLELCVEKFAKQQGQLTLVDLERPQGQSVERRGARMVLREQFRRFLRRQFPGWTLAELSTEADLTHSLSPSYPRALVKQGGRAWAALGTGAEARDAAGALTFGLIWLDYLRKRERRLTVEGLALYTPAGAERLTLQRLRYLNPRAAAWTAWAYDESGLERRLDPADYGNLDTSLENRRDGAGPEHRANAGTPERVLEARVRENIEAIDATLVPEAVYSQVPALAGGQRGIMDLVSVDRSGRLAVLELKASEDIHLPLQALDYWMRVVWHLERGEFAGRGYFPGIELRTQPPRLLLVAPALDFHPQTETVLRYFSPAIEVMRIGLAVEWRKSIEVMFRLKQAERPG